MSYILVIEDNDDVRKLFRTLLVGEGYQIQEAVNGVEALSIIKNGEPPLLVLLDMDMPIMNGVDFLRVLRSETRLEDVPVVMVTANEKAEAHQQVQHEVDHFMPKPVDVCELLDIISKVLKAPR